MHFKYWSISVLLCLCASVFAQESIPIHGVVKDAHSLQPIEGASIIGNDAFAITSLDGSFQINQLPKGTYTFEVSHLGYAAYTLTVSSSTSVIEVFLEPSITFLEDIEVHSLKKHLKSKASPLVSHMVSKSYMENNRENSLMQTLEKIPGVSTITIGSGNSKPVIRGLGFNRVVVVQNGIKHQAQQWGSDHGLEIDQYGVETIEIIKGPASLLYGSDAIAGVINIQAPEVPVPNSFSGSVHMLGETNNDLLGISTGVQGRKNTWFYRGRITYKDFGDYKVPTDQINYENYIFDLHDNYLRNTAGNEANLSASVGYVKDRIKSETFISNVNSKNGFFANAHGLEVRSSKIDYDASNRDVDFPFHKVNHFKVINSTTMFRGDHRFQIDLGFQNNHRAEYSEPAPHGYMPTPPNSKERIFDKNTYSFNLSDQISIGSRHKLSTGLTIEHQHNNIGGWGFLIPGFRSFNIGGFVFNDFEISRNFHLLAGLRYDYGSIHTDAYYDWFASEVTTDQGIQNREFVQRSQDKKMRFDNISASVGVSYTHNNTSYKFNIGKSFRMPLANELASDGVNYHMYRYEKGNLNLDPEESYQLDIEIAHETPVFSVAVSPFLNLYSNYIYLNPTSNYHETLQIYEYSQSKVLRMGGELSASTLLFEKLRFEANAEFVYSKQTSGPKKDFGLPFSPPLSGNLMASYAFGDKLFFKSPTIGAEYRITAAQDEIVPPEKRTDAWQVLNLSLQSEVSFSNNKQPLQIRVKINNVLDTKYYNHTSYYRLIDIPEPGRNLSLSLTLPFGT